MPIDFYNRDEIKKMIYDDKCVKISEILNENRKGFDFKVDGVIVSTVADNKAFFLLDIPDHLELLEYFHEMGISEITATVREKIGALQADKIEHGVYDKSKTFSMYCILSVEDFYEYFA